MKQRNELEKDETKNKQEQQRWRFSLLTMDLKRQCRSILFSSHFRRSILFTSWASIAYSRQFPFRPRNVVRNCVRSFIVYFAPIPFTLIVFRGPFHTFHRHFRSSHISCTFHFCSTDPNIYMHAERVYIKYNIFGYFHNDRITDLQLLAVTLAIYKFTEKWFLSVFPPSLSLSLWLSFSFSFSVYLSPSTGGRLFILCIRFEMRRYVSFG